MQPRATVLLSRTASLLILCGAVLFGAPPVHAQNVLTEIRSIHPRELRMDGFVLKQEQDVRIDVVGPAARRARHGLSNAWILDARTREVVWEFDLSTAQKERDAIRETAETVRLPAGVYEVYYASFPYTHGDAWDDDRGWDDWDQVTFSSLGDFIGDLFDEIFDDNGWDRRGRYDWDDAYRSEAERFGITVSGTSDGYAERDRARLASAFFDDTFVSLTNLRDDQHVQQGFTLARPMDVEVYAVGELHDASAFDYGWIINADTRERVWQMTDRNTQHAGGARKNRVANEVLHLPAGRYAAFFVTDDSHSAEAWNAAPPYDPLVWGMAILPKDPAMRPHVSTFDYEHVRREEAIVDLTRMRDDDYRAHGFALKSPMQVRVYALGEGRDGRMYDYGWIVDAATRERVWQMRYTDTEHAGGVEKNRVVDAVVRLDAGSYIAYYVTDDSHAYGDWNSGAPFDPESWGLTVLPVDPNSRAAVLPYEERADPAVLAHLTGVRDDARQKARFTLDRDANVRVYAVGEGDGGRMYDYGWIEDNRTGKVVWEMTYRMTERAGGADKNRLVNTVVPLKAGDYTVYFETDDSHSFGDWNSTPPDDPASWGITLRRAGR